MSEKARVPKKGAGRRLAEKLKELGRQPPPEELVNKINGEDKKKVASPVRPVSKDLDPQ